MNRIEPVLETPTRDSIIEQVIQHKDVRTFVNTRCSKHKEFRDDLYQELMLILLKVEEVKLIEIYVKGDLHRYIIGIVRIMLEGNRSTFRNTYIKPKTKKVYNMHRLDVDLDMYEDFVENINSELPQTKTDDRDVFMDLALVCLDEHIEKLDVYDRRLLKTFLQEGNNQARVSEKHKLNPRYVSESMKRNKEALKQSITEAVKIPDELIPEFNLYVNVKKSTNYVQTDSAVDHFDEENNNGKIYYQKKKKP